MAYTHLHIHTEHSLLDGMIRVDELFDYAALQGQQAVAITDHGSLSAMWKAQRAADRAGVQLIVGLETYLAIGDRWNTGDSAAPTTQARGFIEIDYNDSSGDEGTDAERESNGDEPLQVEVSPISQLAHHLVLAATTANEDVEQTLSRLASAPNRALEALDGRQLDLLRRAGAFLAAREEKPKGGKRAKREQDAMQAAESIARAAGAGAIPPLVHATRPLKRRYHEHLTLIARNEAGWRNLLAMQNEASKPASRYQGKPRIDRRLLAEHRDGIICLTGCLGGPVLGPLSRGEREEAERNLDELLDLFGPDDLYVELMEHGIEQESAIIPDAVDLARSRGVRIVATNDAHYLRPDQARAHAAWLAHQSKSTVANPKYAFHGAGFHVADEREMRAKRPEGWWQDACDETARITARIEHRVIPEPQLRLPHFPVPEGFADTAAYFRHKVLEGARAMLGTTELSDAFRNRLNEEVAVVKQMGMLDYFLIVEDMITWAREQGILVGRGRGSAAGSLTSYLLGIHDVDPLEHGLLFERFLEPGRAGLPDIDTDFEAARRGEVFEYLAQKWGRDKVARIGSLTFSRTKKAIKDAARVLEHDQVGARLAKEVPIAGGAPLTFAKLDDLELREADGFRAALATSGVEGEEVTKLAREFEGLVSALGIHACGFLISDEPIAELVPLRYDSNAVAGDDNALAYTAWDGGDVEDFGLCKIDVLGLTNLDIVREAIANIEGEDLSLGAIPHPDTQDDPRVERAWRVLRDGLTSGLFQVQGAGITELVQDIRPSSWADLTAILALYRPGPMSVGMHAHYGARKHGHEPVDWAQFTDDPLEQQWLEKVLGATYGITVYQEQVMQLAQVIAGFDAGERSQLRKAMGKKKRDIMVKMRAEFTSAERCARVYTDPVTGEVVSPVFRPETAERVWNAVEGAADYLFNKCIPADTRLDLAAGGSIALGALEAAGLPELLTIDARDGRLRAAKPVAVHRNGVQQLYRVTLANGMSVRATIGHRFLAAAGWFTVAELRPGMVLVVSGLPGVRAAQSGNPTAASQVVSVVADGVEPTFDVEMPAGTTHSFIANGIVSHNSHSQAYARLTFDTAFLKANWPAEFGAGILATQHDDEKRAGAMLSLAREGVEVLPPCVNRSQVQSKPEGGRAVRIGLGEIKGVGQDAAEAIIRNRERYGGAFSELWQVATTTITGEAASQKVPVGTYEALIQAGALDEFGPRLGMMIAVRSLHQDDALAIPDAEWSSLERSQRQRRSLLTSFGEHPLTRYWADVERWRPESGIINEQHFLEQRATVETLPQGNNVRVTLIAVLGSMSSRNYRGGKLQDFQFEGATGASVAGVMWNDRLLDQEALGGFPEIGAIVAVRGEVRSRRFEVESVDEAGNITVEVRQEPQVTVSRIDPVPITDDSRRSMAPPPFGALSFGAAADPSGGAAAREQETQPQLDLGLDDDDDDEGAPAPEPESDLGTGRSDTGPGEDDSAPETRVDVMGSSAARYPMLNRVHGLARQGITMAEFLRQLDAVLKHVPFGAPQPERIELRAPGTGMPVLHIRPERDSAHIQIT